MELGARFPRACVTGASSGLGRAFAEALRAAGVEVWGTSRQPDALELPAGQGADHWVALDLGALDSLARFLAWLEGDAPEFALFINNAGSGVFAPFEAFPRASLEQQLDVLLAAPAQLTRTVYAQMRRRDAGTLVNVSSLAAEFPLPGMAAYSAAKAGLSGLSQALALESLGSGVTVVDFRPGDFYTGFAAATETPADPLGQAWAAVAERQRALMAEAPHPSVAADVLLRALQSGRSGTVRAGTFFQARLGPLAARLLPEGWLRQHLRRYFRLA